MQNSAEFSWDSDDITDCEARLLLLLEVACLTPALNLPRPLSRSLFFHTHSGSKWIEKLLIFFLFLLRFHLNQGVHHWEISFLGETGLKGALHPDSTNPSDFISQFIGLCQPLWPPLVTYSASSLCSHSHSALHRAGLKSGGATLSFEIFRNSEVWICIPKCLL